MLSDQEISELMESGPSAITASAWQALCDQAKAAILKEFALREIASANFEGICKNKKSYHVVALEAMEDHENDNR